MLLMLLLPACLRSQEYSYTRYDIQHGLAGSTVYSMLQDRQGFLWFGTETGVSRFDGTHFKNFSTIHGLPDNQVLEMFEDSKGRIWMAPFNKSVCYYYNGKIYNQQNDPVLRTIKPSGHVLYFAEDRQGNILVVQNKRIHLIRPDNHITVFATAKEQDANFMSADTVYGGTFQVLNREKVYELRDGRMVYIESINLPFDSHRFAVMRKGIMVWRFDFENFTVRIRDGKRNQTTVYNAFTNMHKINVLNDSLISFNTQTGTLVCNLNTHAKQTFLPREAISKVYQDREGNFWFCTLGHGIFLLNSAFIANLGLMDRDGNSLGAYSLAKFRNGWLVGADMATLYTVPKERNSVELVYRLYRGLPERVTDLEVENSGTILMATDGRIDRLTPNFTLIDGYHGLSSKAMIRVRGDSMLIATGRDVIWFNSKTCQPLDTIWHERSTTVFYENDTVYIGTLDGLFLHLKNGTIIDMGDSIPQFRGRIMDIGQARDGTLWVATYSGLFAYSGRKILSSLTEQTGLISNICRTLDIYKNELWVGTNKGLQKINISNPLQPVPDLKLSNELASNIINAVLADSTMVAVATPEGVSIFDKTMVAINAGIDLHLDNIMVSGRRLPWTGEAFHLPNKDNNIRFEFAGISYRSGGDIRYEYRLLGLDSAWKQTRENALSYPTLPGGDYRLQIQAINKFGIKSEVLSVPFSIEKQLWQKTWFQVLFTIVSVTIVWLLLAWRIRVIKGQEAEKNNIRKKIASLEQLALKSQMNPHFIFNSLNSIQHYVMDKDIEGANKFITGFSRLIRQTLDISTRHEISLAEEISYLSTYLQLEKIRLENKFSFEVSADPALNPEACFIPPMILQPFVENCVRHGIRYRHDNNGKVVVAFKKAGNQLDCVIEDNGVGRKVARSHKSNNPIEYQSKGISLTSDRVELMNKHNARAITIHIYDLEDGNGAGTGTRVIISFPLQQTE